MLKKIFLIIFSLLLLFNSIVSPVVVLAVDEPDPWYSQNPVDWMVKVYDDKNPSEIFGERYTAAQTQWIIWGVLTTPFTFLGDTNRKGVICLLGMVVAGNNDFAACAPLLEAMFQPIKDFFERVYVAEETPKNLFEATTNINDRSFSGVGYLAEKLENLSIISPARAQGFGYGELNRNFSKYWSGTRDIAYALSVLVIIVFSFMIMFRVKISPQVVISIQSSLPKLAGALILATFSFAIAGLLIDLMYVVSGLLTSLLITADFASNWQRTYSIINPNNTLDFGLYFFVWMFQYCIMFLVGLVLAALTSILSITGIIPGVVWSILMIGILIWCIILMFFYAFKIPWILIKNLISIYVSIVVAPIQIMMGTFVPSLGFGQWLKKLIAELLVYPVTGLFMLLAMKLLLTSYKFSFLNLTNLFGIEEIINAIASYFGETFGADIIWVPPIIGSSEAVAPFLFMLASFGLIVALPKVVDIMKMMIMGEKFAFGTAIGEAWGPIDWAKKQALGSPIARTFSEGFGYMGAARMLNRAAESDFWTNAMNRTSWLTGINSKNAKDVASTWENRATQVQNTAQTQKTRRQG